MRTAYRLFLSTLLFLFICVRAQAQLPKAYFSFDGNVTDTSGAGLGTTAVPSSGWTPTYVADRFGVAGKAIDISSGSKSLQLTTTANPGNSNLSFGLRNVPGTNTSFTLTAWVYFSSTAGYSTVFGNLGMTEAGTLHAGLNTGSTLTHFGFNAGNEVNGATAGLNTGVWYHLAFVFDTVALPSGSQATASQRIFINGVPEVTRFGVTPGMRGVDLFLGNWGTATDANNDMRGYMDDVAVYNVALKGDQIAALASGVSPMSLPAAGTYSGPKMPGVQGSPGNWGVREIKAYPGIAYGTLVNADRIVRAYATTPGGTVAQYQAPVLNFSDDEGAGGLGYFPNEGDFGTNTPGADDSYLMIAKCAVRIPAGQGGDYTFGFRGDDGSRLRVLGKQFISSTRIYNTNPADPAQNGDGLAAVNGTGDSNTLGVVNLAPGDYNLEFVWWEGGGGSSVEVFAAKGAKTSVDSAFQLIGNTAAGGLEIVRDPDTVPTFTANSSTSVFVHSGSPANFTLAWSVANAGTTLSINQGIGVVAQSGSLVVASPATTTTYTITATTGTDVNTKSVTVYVNSPPVVTFIASDYTVTSGSAVTLSWVAEGATTLTLNPGAINVTGTTTRVVNPTVTTIYTLTATNPAGSNSPTLTVTMGAAPTITSFTVADANPLYGAETTLNWVTSGATSLTITPGIGTFTAASGSASIFPLATTTYTLTASNDFGASTATATVNQPTPIGVTAATGFTARRVFATTSFPFTGQGYLQSALSLLGGQNVASTSTIPNYTTVNFTDGTDGDFTVGNVNFPGGGSTHHATEITATLVVNTPGEYTFAVNSSWGSRLRIDGVDVILDDGTHGPGGGSGTINLTKSTSTLQLITYGQNGSSEVELSWIRPNLQWTLLTTITPAAPIVRGGLIISEFMADNENTLADEDGTFPDWIEIWNSTASPVNLSGYFLTDDVANFPARWALPNWTLGANQYVIIFASAKNRSPAQAIAGQDNPGTLAQPHAHTNFSLSKNGGYLGLTQSNGAGGYNQVSFFANYPIQKNDTSYGSSDSEGYIGFIEVPTPGTANSTTVTDFVKDTVFSHPRGRYSAPFNLTITSATPGTTIRYTLNGTAPTASSGTVYTGPIPISATTSVRAAAFKVGWMPTNVDTCTYLFVSDIAAQTTATAIAMGFPNGAVNGQAFRYGMALANVTAGGGNLASLTGALSAAPSVCLTLNIADMVDATTGFYVNPSKRGLFWERPVSMEYINTAGTSEFQIDCGVRTRGGASRAAGNPKHAFHMYFRGSLYEGALKYKLFGNVGASEFSQIDLRCEQNYSWSKDNSGSNTFIREEWGRLTQRDMGQPYARTSYFHLYINGIYWGVYNFEERTEAAFGETYLGGTKDTTDTVKSAGNANGYNTEMTDGNFLAWQSLYTQAIALKNDTGTEASRTAKYMQMRGLNPDGTRNLAYPILLDVDNLADYQLSVFYSGSYDAPMSTFLNNASNNWFGVRDRSGARGWAFFAHDYEHGLDAPSQPLASYNRVGPWGGTGNNNWLQPQYNTREQLGNTIYIKSNPHYLHELLAYSAEYRQRFADRVQKHFFNGGSLTTTGATNRVTELSNQVDPIVHAEAARWGSTGLHKNTWITAKAAVLNFINNGGTSNPAHTVWAAQARTSLILLQLQGYQEPVGVAKPLAMTLAAPAFSGQFGGLITPPYAFNISNPGGTGTLYYTLNGADPRPIGGGAPAGGTPTGASPIAINLTLTTTVRARVYDSATSTWSALTEADYILGTAASSNNLVISKIHYNPSSAGDLDEYIEIMNISAQTIDLTKCKFTLGVLFDFADGTTLAPGARRLIVRDAAAFGTAFPGVSPALILGTFQAATSLDNGGEQIQLIGATLADIRNFSYSDSGLWPTGPDGSGPALVLFHPELNPAHDLGVNWRESSTAGGNPGNSDTLAYTSWASLNSVTDTLGILDTDGDGLTNLVEYALGTNPNANSNGALPTASTQSINVSGVVSTYLTLTYRRAIGHDDVAYAVEYTNNLSGSWTPAVLESGPTFNNDGTETLTYRAPVPVSAETKQFLHLKMVR